MDNEFGDEDLFGLEETNGIDAPQNAAVAGTADVKPEPADAGMGQGAQETAGNVELKVEGDEPQPEEHDHGPQNGQHGGPIGQMGAEEEQEGAAEAGSSVYVSNLQWWTTDADLERLCSQHGTVVNVRFTEERLNGRSRGSAVVEFREQDAAAKCKKGLHGQEINGKTCGVSFASATQVASVLNPKAPAAAGGQQKHNQGRAGGDRNKHHNRQRNNRPPPGGHDGMGLPPQGGMGLGMAGPMGGGGMNPLGMGLGMAPVMGLGGMGGLPPIPAMGAMLGMAAGGMGGGGMGFGMQDDGPDKDHFRGDRGRRGDRDDFRDRDFKRQRGGR